MIMLNSVTMLNTRGDLTMKQLTITLPDELEDEVRSAVREGKHGSISDFVRDAIKNELLARPPYWMRFIAAQVLENNKLLKQLAKDTNWGGDELLAALQRGYIGDYGEAELLVAHDELPPEGTEFVHDVLGMYGELQRGYDEHGKGDPELGKQVLFKGFDGNAGDGYLGYTNFLIDNGKYSYVRPLDKVSHLNSHSSHVVEMYRRMLGAYQAVQNSRKRFEYRVLTLDEVKQILAEQIHPENRKQ